jgi:hypothetical protein
MAPIMARLASLLVLPLLFLSAFADSDRCFFPNGKLANFAAGCWDANGTQMALCCQSGDLCLSNRICASKLETNHGELRYYRGSCLDMSWSDPGCPRYCLERDRIDKVVPMRRCEEPPTKWFCGNAPTDDDHCEPAEDDLEVPGMHANIPSSCR